MFWRKQLFMHPFLLNKCIDLVSFDEVKLLMFKDDNLYNIGVPEHRKNQSLSDYQTVISQSGYRPSPVNSSNVDEITESHHGVHLLLSHFWKNGVDFTVLDIGSHIGVFGIRVGNVIRTFAKNNKVVTFDPTEAGALVDYNIELNGLGENVRHEKLAVGDFNGMVLFSYSPGFSDSTHFSERDSSSPVIQQSLGRRFLQKTFREKLSAIKRKSIGSLLQTDKHSKIAPIPTYNFIAPCVDILSYLKSHDLNTNLFVKIDIEGFDAIVIDQLLKLMPDRLVSIIFEFKKETFGGSENSVKYLENLSQSFYLFDLAYSLRPVHFNPLESNDFRGFVEHVANRTYAHTDVLALDKNTPNCDLIMKRLVGLKESDGVW